LRTATKDIPLRPQNVSIPLFDKILLFIVNKIVIILLCLIAYPI